MVASLLVAFIQFLFLSFPQIQQVPNQHHALFPVIQSRRLGYIDGVGQIKIVPQFDPPCSICEPEVDVTSSFREGLVGAKQGTAWGFIDETGAWAVKPQYDDVMSFSEGLAAVEMNKKWGFIDRTGKI